jgi:hypothetical protein
VRVMAAARPATTGGADEQGTHGRSLAVEESIGCWSAAAPGRFLTSAGNRIPTNQEVISKSPDTLPIHGP